MNLSKVKRVGIVTLGLIILCLQDLRFISFGGIAIKYYHLYFLALCPCLLKKCIIGPPKSVLWFFYVILMVSLFNIPILGMSSFLFNYFFVLYEVFVLLNVSFDFRFDDWINATKKATLFITVLIIIKDINEIDRFIAFFKSPYGHPVIHTLMGGGPNIEATYMAMFVPLFIKDKKLMPMLIISLIISVAYASRTAILLNVLCILWIAFNYMDSRKYFKLMTGTSALVLLAFYMYLTGNLDFVIKRFSNVGEEAGSLGRLNMWMYALDLFESNPFGYGIGNSMESLMRFTNNSYMENNFHNIYIQMFIDLGLIGGAYYIIMVVSFLIKEFRNILRNPIHFILFMYIFSSLLQFRGAEAIIYFFLAAYFQMKTVKKEVSYANNQCCCTGI